MHEDDQTYFFDHERLRVLLTDLVRDRGVLHWRTVTAERRSGVLVSSSETPVNPVSVTVVGEEAVVMAGLGAMHILTCAHPGAEDDVADYVGAVIDGAATEYGFFNPDGPPQMHLAVSTPTRSSTFDTTDAILIRRLPAWPAAARGAD